ncbi:MAG: DoxX family protein [Bacteroidetes bacterium]|nr:MAG: DoxX family protein [Bacteroidota bacterium]
MHTILHNHEIAGALIARVFLGLLFFFQGFDAVFRVKISGVLQTIEDPLSRIGLPRFFIVSGAYFTSYVELIGGFFLIIGFAKYYAMYLLGIDLVIASIAFGIVKPMWDMQYAFPRLALLIFLLMIPSQWDVISVDYVWSIIKFIKSITPQ